MREKLNFGKLGNGIERYYRKKEGTVGKVVQYLECWVGGQKQKRR
jgi:hypothetical protein